ncbi:uncharacterized protein clnk [Xenentodon cancila]
MMEPFRVHRNRNQTCPCCNKETEHEYDVVADQQEVINVHILPARPIDDEQEYAGVRHRLYLLPRNWPTAYLNWLSKVPTVEKRVPSIRHHHEWPQTKEDIDQHDFHPTEKPQIYCEEDWYIGPCSRADAEHALHLVNKDGAFLVRDCSLTTTSEPLVLVVYHEKKVFNVKIRFIKSTGKYALGTGQRSNDEFDSVAEIIKFHSIFPIVLISGRNVPGSRYPENCVLTYPITKRDVGQLLQ